MLASLSLSFTAIQPAYAATGYVDTYLHLDSTATQYVVAADDAGFTIPNAITMEAWIRPDATCVASGECVIMIKENSYALSVVSGKFNFALYNGGWFYYTTGVSARAGIWQHIAFTRPTSTATSKLYINGRLVSTTSAGDAGTSALSDSIYNFSIGARNGLNLGVNAIFASGFTGDIDEVKVWQTERTQTQVQSDMNSYGPTGDSNLKLYYDFNDVSGGVVSNKASGATSGTQLTVKSSPTFTNLDSATVITGNLKISTFGRTYLSANGWPVPIGISSIDAMVIGGGGGGGNNVGGGGSGGGGYMITSLPTASSTTIPIHVGFGGAGGSSTAAGTLTYDGTSLINGQDGDSSTVTINGSTYVGGGGGGGPTYWANSYCAGTGSRSTWAQAGPYVGSGGTGNSGGTGGTPSSTQSTANGSSGYSFNITGATVTYGSGGGSGGGYASAVNGNGADSLGGNGGSPGASGTVGRGAGGGGGYTSCNLGGAGGTGVVVLRYAAYSGDFTTGKGATAVYRTANTLTVTVTSAGKVTFYVKGKAIPGCKSIPTISSTTITASCNWRPSIHIPTPVTAIFTPSASGSSPVSLNAGEINVAARSGKR